jgi:hypothetical protein
MSLLQIHRTAAASRSSLHPARFWDKLIVAIGEMLASYGPIDILDPFDGNGRVHELRELREPGHHTTGVEIEPVWVALHPGTIVGNSLHLGSLFAGRKFDAVVTSPAFGNRLADHHTNNDTCKHCGGTGIEGARVCRTCLGVGISMRRSYTHDLRRMTGDSTAKLHKDNAGAMHWGPSTERSMRKSGHKFPGSWLALGCSYSTSRTMSATASVNRWLPGTSPRWKASASRSLSGARSVLAGSVTGRTGSASPISSCSYSIKCTSKPNHLLRKQRREIHAIP